MTKLPPVQPLPFTTQTIALDCISANPNNPRKYFDQEKLKELAAGITANGILQAPAVRPKKAAGVAVPGKFVLIWGERRALAAGMAGLKEIEVRVYDVDEMKAAELALIENDDREDLTPLERADGYRALQKKHGLSVDEIAERVNKARSAVYSAIKLCDLVAVGRKAIEDKELQPSIGELIAALPAGLHTELVQKALGIFGESWRQTKRKLSFREMKELIRDEYMLKIKGAPFDAGDANLVPKAGACTNCPKRTGAQGDMFAGEKVPDLCQDKDCYATKVAAHRRVVVAKAKAEEKSVLPAAASKQALEGRYNSEWVKLTDTFSGSAGGKKTVAAELEGTDLEAQFAVGPTGRLVKVAKKSDVRKALKEKGSKLADSQLLDSYGSSRAPATKEEKEAQEKKQAERAAAEALAEKVAEAAIAKVVEYIEAKGLTGKLLRLVVGKCAMTGYSSPAFKRRGLELGQGGDYANDKDFEKHFGTAKDNKLLGFLFECSDEDLTRAGQGEYSETLSEACALAGVDLLKLEEELTPKAKAAEGVIKWAVPTPTGGVAGKGKSGTKYAVYTQEIGRDGVRAWFYQGGNGQERGMYEQRESAQEACAELEAALFAQKKAAPKR